MPELVNRRARVIALVRDDAPSSQLVLDGWSRRVEVVRGSLDNPALLKRTLAEYEIQTVFHLAAQAIVGIAKVDPVGTLEANVRGTWNLLEAARQLPVMPHVIVASSDKAYGASSNLPYAETHPMDGMYPYDVSKSCADLICRMYAKTYQLPVCVTRCGNLFGGGDLNFSRTVPGAILATLRGERFLIRSDGLYVRDFIYVRDAAEAYLRLAEALAAEPELAGEAFNFSLEIRLTVLDLVRRILSLMGRDDLEPIVQNIASAEIREQYMVASKAHTMLNWAPRYGLDEGLRETIAWYKRFEEIRLTSPGEQSSQAAVAAY